MIFVKAKTLNKKVLVLESNQEDKNLSRRFYHCATHMHYDMVGKSLFYDKAVAIWHLDANRQFLHIRG